MRNSNSSLYLRLPGGEGTGNSLLADDLDGDSVHVRDPEGEPHLPTGPAAKHLAHRVLLCQCLDKKFEVKISSKLYINMASLRRFNF